MTDKVLPTLVHNTGLRVPQGSTITLTPDALFLADPDSPHTALSYKVVHPPQYGQLLLKGQTLVAGSIFTQQNIQDLAVSFRHSGGASQIDRFRFTASDSTERGFLLDGKLQTEPVFFILQVSCNHLFWNFFLFILLYLFLKIQKGLHCNIFFLNQVQTGDKKQCRHFGCLPSSV